MGGPKYSEHLGVTLGLLPQTRQPCCGEGGGWCVPLTQVPGSSGDMEHRDLK